MRRRLLIAALLLSALAGCGTEAANGASPEPSVSASDESFAAAADDPGGNAELAAQPAATGASKAPATTTAPAANSGKAPTPTFALASRTFTFNRAGRTLRTV